MPFARPVVAGLIGGAIIDLFLIAVRAVPFPGVYQFIASNLVGPVAFTSSAYIALGLVLHFGISVAFAFAYAYVAERRPALIAHPVVGGTILGIAVMAVMQIVLSITHAAPPPSIAGVMMGLLSHVLFFGQPVAWYLARAGRQRALTA